MSRKSVLISLEVLLLSLALTTVVSAADASLVGWWRFDDGSGTIARDSSGYGNDGTLAGGTQWVAGIMGGALQLTGSGYVVIDGVGKQVTNTSFSLSIWIKTTMTSGEGEVFALNESGSSHPLLFYVYNGRVGRYDGSDVRYPNSPLLADDQWHMMTFVRNGSTAYIYIDGVEVVNYTSTFSLATVTRWSIGQEWDSGPSDFYTGTVDDARIYTRPLSPEEVLAVMKGGDDSLASEPSPADKATDVPRDAALSWTPGEFARTHDVYFGTVFADVNTASRTNAKDTLASQGQAGTTFDPEGLLAYGQTYYWRVDEVNAPPSPAIFKGEVWSFTVEPYAYPIQNVTATASSSQAGMGPEKTVDGSGLNAVDEHGTEPTTMWMSAGVQPNWIQYEFDQVYKLHELRVWNSNQLIEPFIGFGSQNVKIECSVDGSVWTPVADVPEFARASGLATYTANTTVSLAGASAKYVKLTIEKGWGGLPQTGLSEVRFFHVPVQAREPVPAVGGTGIELDPTLSWRAGREAASHTVYFGPDQDSVTAGTAAAKSVSDNRFDPPTLEFGTTYFWKVDEVGETGTYGGDVWSFTTKESALVEDFESYTDDEGNRIYQAWIDGWENNSGSVVGYLQAPFAERTIVHGGKQSMPLEYDNTKAPFYSETELTFAVPQDWTANGIKSLSLWFQGVAGNGGQLYVKINGTKVLYDGDAADLARAVWQVWNIDLSKAGQVNRVRSLAIGVEGNGTKGRLYIDDIRLYPKTPEYVTPVQPAATGLVAHYTLDEGSGTTVRDSSGKGNNGTFGPEGTPRWVAGKFGGALQLDGNDDYVNVDALAKSMPADNNFTVSAWIKTTTSGATRYVVASNDSASGHDFAFGLASNGSLLIQANTARNYPPALNDDTWHMITYVRDGTTAYLYTDGLLVGTETPTGNPAGQVRWSIGQEWDPPSPSDEFEGTVDDVRIYARPLSAAEVAGLAGMTKPRHQAF